MSSAGKATSWIPEYKEWALRLRGAHVSTFAQHVRKGQVTLGSWAGGQEGIKDSG